MTTRRARFAEIQHTLSAPQRQAVREHHEIQRQVAEVARTVVQHPGYQMFLDHLDAHLEALTKRRANLDRMIADGPELGEALAALKLQLRDVAGEIRGLTLAKALIPQMVEAGERAVEALAGVQA